MAAFLALAVALTGFITHPGSHSTARREPCAQIAWANPDGGQHDTQRDVKALIRCAVRRWDVPGGADKALAVADCESDFLPWLRGGTGDAHFGVFQQRDIYWSDRWEKWGKPLGLSSDPFDARSNIIVSIRQAHEVGWGPWACG